MPLSCWGSWCEKIYRVLHFILWTQLDLTKRVEKLVAKLSAKVSRSRFMFMKSPRLYSVVVVFPFLAT